MASSWSTCVIYDNDVLAVAGLGVAHEMGFSVPDDLSLVAWDDSPFCEVVHPPLTAVRRDIPAHGALASRKLLDVIGHGSHGDFESPRGRLTPRASTGPAPARAGTLRRVPAPAVARRRAGGR